MLIGSPLNLSALAARIKRKAQAGLSFVLAGGDELVAKEDAATAALLLERLGEPVPTGLPSPPALGELEALFLSSLSGQRLISLGYEQDVRLCADIDRYPIVPLFRDGRVAASF